jgi:hypothetical protein
MRKTAFVALIGVLLLPGTLLAQTGPQTAAIESPTPASPAPPAAGTITREQYIERAQERASQRAAARFDQMDTNHDGMLDRAERRAWRDQHAHRPAAPAAQPAAQ